MHQLYIVNNKKMKYRKVENISNYISKKKNRKNRTSVIKELVEYTWLTKKD